METCTCRRIIVINCCLRYLRAGSNNFTRNMIALLNRPQLVGLGRQLRKKWGCRPTKSKRFARRSTMIIRILRMMISTSEMWMRSNNNGAGRPQTKGMLDVSIKLLGIKSSIAIQIEGNAAWLSRGWESYRNIIGDMGLTDGIPMNP